ncbi:response regulator transcription factor [Kibdelosporangium philippinense]|uniref:Response regulator transcription factor n=1 Tax=Kibdelosporangium philippinense TaxID=211113 RepID=A0ABS8ZC31_9PSEU|nr:response regulator transcription factor [Kibdelosporangium philippinense]MCE7003387.1 response regulator transcription factor [Kibdelosporangium philippinense]
MRVLIVDDHPLTRNGVRAGLDGGLMQVFEAGDVDAASRSLAVDRPHVVLVDLRLGALDGIDFIQHVVDCCPDVRILVLSQASLVEVVRAIRAGAHGYVSKAAPTAELRRAVAAVLDGPVVPPELAVQLVKEFHEGPGLSPREREVLRILARGYDNQEIAAELAISVRTVNRHLESIRDKLGTRRRSELIRIARARLTG